MSTKAEARNNVKEAGERNIATLPRLFIEHIPAHSK